MDPHPYNSLQKLEDCNSEILKRHLLQSGSPVACHSTSQHNVVINSLRPSIANSMLMSSMQAPPQPSAQLLAHTMTPVKIQPAPRPYPLHVSTVHVPVHIPMPTPSMGVPMQLSGPITASNMSLPIQVSTSSLPVQLTSDISVPLTSQNIQLTTGLPPMVQLCGNGRLAVDNSVDLTIKRSETNGELPKIKLGNTNTTIQAIPPKPIQLSSVGSMQRPMRNTSHMVYIQTPTGLKPVASSEVMSHTSNSGNPKQIIVRKPVTSTSGLQIVSNANIAPKVTIANKSSTLTPVNPAQPIVIQKSKSTDKIIVPGSLGKSVTFIGGVNKQNSNSTQNQKVYITSMAVPKPKKSKFVVPVSLPPTMSSKGPIFNFQIANGQLQNDSQGNITVMRDANIMNNNDSFKVNGMECTTSTDVIKSENSFAISIPGSRAESTGEQEYTLSIPDTNASMSDDIFTVSIADEDGAEPEETSFTLAIPEKGKNLLTKNVLERDVSNMVVPAPAILRRSYSDNGESQMAVNTHIKRRISLCVDNVTNRHTGVNMKKLSIRKEVEEHKVPSLFCDEKLDKEMDIKVSPELLDKKCIIERHIIKECSTNKIHLLNEKLKEEEPLGLKWDNGVAALHGSSLKFHTNEFGLIDVINSEMQEQVKYETPLKEQNSARGKKANSPEDMYRCDGCGCHGMLAEFITPNYCSATCESDVNKTLQKKKDRERIENLRRKSRIKKTFVKKRLSETELLVKEDKVPLKPYDSMPSMPVDVRLSVDEDSDKSPWMCGKNGFSWMKYLDYCKAKAAPVKLFKDPFPYNKNAFRVGMRLEAVDPSHPSLFCVVSVAELQGYRMRLHFDDYPEIYDFWVNADSVDIFPAGWCEKNGRKLKTPPSHNGSFSWPQYLRQVKASAAQKHLFPHLGSNVVKPNGFRIGMKLEAEDRKNNLICVATVSDMHDNRLLINFDSWDEMYDYWVDPTSPYIHPVGWAEENNMSLTPPNFYKDPDTFTWESYLAESGASAVPARAFKTRPPMGFKVGMKLEIVDKRIPFLIRVASISEVKGHQVRVSFDGWADELSYWLDDDSPDIHPVGWCLKTGHPLEPPLSEQDLETLGVCGVGGCRGLGSALGGSHKCHSGPSDCPYRAGDSPRPDRLSKEPSDSVAPRTRRVVSRIKPRGSSSPNSTDSKPRGRPPKHKPSEHAKPDPASDEESVGSNSGKRWRHSSKEVESSVTRDYLVRAGGQALPCGLHLQPLLHSLPPEPGTWTPEEVVTLVEGVAGPEAAQAVRAGRLGGAALLMASREELVDCLRLRLGPALKIYTAVKILRHSCM